MPFAPGIFIFKTYIVIITSLSLHSTKRWVSQYLFFTSSCQISALSMSFSCFLFNTELSRIPMSVTRAVCQEVPLLLLFNHWENLMQLWLLQDMSLFLESLSFDNIQTFEIQVQWQVKICTSATSFPWSIVLSLRNYLHAIQVRSLQIHGCTRRGKIDGGNLPPFWLIQGELGIRWTELAL